MAEFTEVMRQVKRLCEAQLKCKKCPLLPECEGSGFISSDDAGKAETIEHKVMDWAEKNPELRYPTWKEWQNERFPDADILCPRMFMPKRRVVCALDKMCSECVKDPIPADVAEKLGIKPVGGGE